MSNTYRWHEPLPNRPDPPPPRLPRIPDVGDRGWLIQLDDFGGCLLTTYTRCVAEPGLATRADAPWESCTRCYRTVGEAIEWLREETR